MNKNLSYLMKRWITLSLYGRDAIAFIMHTFMYCAALFVAIGGVVLALYLGYIMIEMEYYASAILTAFLTIVLYIIMIFTDWKFYCRAFKR